MSSRHIHLRESRRAQHICEDLEFGMPGDDKDSLVERIYEAAFIPDVWPAVLDELSALTDSAGGAVLALAARQAPRWAASAVVAPHLERFVAGGAWKTNERARRWTQASHQGFLRDIDLFSVEIGTNDSIPDKIQTHGLGWQLGTVVPMPSGEAVVFSLERHRVDGPHSPGIADRIDPFRPHLARVGLLAARLGMERARTAVETLAALGLPAAVLTSAGRVLVSNTLLDESAAYIVPGARGEMVLLDREANRLFREQFETSLGSAAPVRSIPIPAIEGRAAAILHTVPLYRGAYEMFSGAALVAVLTVVGLSEHLPDTPILSALFDLTPAEARLAAKLGSGATLRGAADAQGIRFSTARSYLESVFRKTGTRQQSQLVALLKSTQPLIGRD
jgi:DNA-binding CsgD family transcriptional regulator